MLRVINLTPHAVHYRPDSGDPLVFPRETCRPLPRVVFESLEPVEVPVGNGDWVRVRPTIATGEVIDLPPYRSGVRLIVSAAVAAACPHRRDLWVPSDLIRDGSGRVTGCAVFALNVHKETL